MVVLKKEENIIYVDFVFDSVLKSVESWYKKYVPHDLYNLKRDSHIFFLKRMYNENRFRNHNTIGLERDKFLEEVDLEFQMRRWD